MEFHDLRTTRIRKPNQEIGIYNYQQLPTDDGTIKIRFEIEFNDNLPEPIDVVQNNMLAILNKYADYLRFVDNSKLIIDIDSYEQNILKDDLKKLMTKMEQDYNRLMRFIKTNVDEVCDYYMNYLRSVADEYQELDMERVEAINNLLTKWYDIKKNIDKLVVKFFKDANFLITSSSSLTIDNLNRIKQRIDLYLGVLRGQFSLLQSEYMSDNI